MGVQAVKELVLSVEAEQRRSRDNARAILQIFSQAIKLRRFFLIEPFIYIFCHAQSVIQHKLYSTTPTAAPVSTLTALVFPFLTSQYHPLPSYSPPSRVQQRYMDISKAEGEEQDPQEAELSPKEQAKARLAAAVTAEAAAQEEDAAADEEALVEEKAIEHDGEVEDEEWEGGKVEGGFLIFIKV